MRHIPFLLLLTLVLVVAGGCTIQLSDSEPPIDTTGVWQGNFLLSGTFFNVSYTLQQQGWSISGEGIVGGYWGRVSGIVRQGSVDLDFYSYDTVQCCVAGYCYQSEYMKLYFTGDIIDGALIDPAAYLSTSCVLHEPFYLRLDRL